jgi:hypothetical protein
VIGLDIQSHDIARAASITDRAATFVLGDMRRATFPRCNVAVFFDTLHYIAIDEQDDVLRRVRMALCPGGVKLLRVGDTSARLRYRFGMWIDRFTRWLARRRIRTPPLAPDFGLDGDACGPGPRRASCSMNGRAPFANRLLVARLPAGADPACEHASPTAK